ncbi:hypothetical protein [Kocuria himachalensis]
MKRGIRMFRRVLRWAFEPQDGLFLTWYGIMLALAVNDQVILFMVTIVATTFMAWASLFGLASIMPPPKPLSDYSSLWARVTWLVKAVWAAVLFGLAALYGASAGITLELSEQLQESGRDPYWEIIREPIIFVVPLVAWAAATWVAIDVARTPDDQKLKILEKIFDRLEIILRQNSYSLYSFPLISSSWKFKNSWLFRLTSVFVQGKIVPLLSANLSPLIIAGFLDFWRTSYA